MPSTKQRLEVWQGIRRKTSGGLTKADLIKNRRGKIVSKRKSAQAHSQNNLKDFLREKGKSIPKDKMLYKKGAKAPTDAGAAPPKPQKRAKKKQASPKRKRAPRRLKTTGLDSDNIVAGGRRSTRKTASY